MLASEVRIPASTTMPRLTAMPASLARPALGLMPTAITTSVAGTTLPSASSPEGDLVGMTGEVTRVDDDGTVTVRLRGLNYPVTTSGEHLSLFAKRQSAGRRKQLFDKPD